jgi:hypothetical protein
MGKVLKVSSHSLPFVLPFELDLDFRIACYGRKNRRIESFAIVRQSSFLHREMLSDQCVG